MKPKSTWWWLAIALGLLGYVLVFERRPAPTRTGGEPVTSLFPEFDPNKVSRIEISRSNEWVRVERQGNQWRLLTPPYPAEPVEIEGFLQAVASLQRRGYVPASELDAQTNVLASFGLDPPLASIALLSGTNRLQFRVGAKTLVHEQLYVQTQDDAGVTLTGSDFLDHLPASVSAWRNRLLLFPNRLAFDRLAVTNSSGSFILELEPTNQLWKLAWPPFARADFNAVNFLIQQLRNTRVSGFVTDAPNADLDKFGLQTPAVELTLGQGTNPVFQLQFGGSPTNDATEVFARYLSRSNIVLVPKAFVDLFRLSHENFRDRTLLVFSAAAVDRVEINAKESVALDRGASGAWQIVQPFNAPADPGAVRRLFDTLAKLKISHFTKDIVEDFSAHGLAKPASQYILKTSGTNSAGTTNRIVAQVDFGAQTIDEIFVRRNAEKSEFTVSFFDSQQLPQWAFEMRDRQLWRFASSNIVTVSVTQNNQTRKWTKEAGRPWSPDPIVNAALEDTLDRLSQLAALSWRAKGEANLKLFGFLEEAFEITLEVNEEGKPRAFMLKLGKAHSPNDRYAATVLDQGQPVIFLIPANLVARIARYLSVPPANP